MLNKPDQLIWLPTGGHIGDAIMIVSLLGEMIEREPKLKVNYIVRRNFERITELSEAYPNIRVIHLPYSPLKALQTVLPLLMKESVLITPPPRGPHPWPIKMLSFLFHLRGDFVIGYKDSGIWHPFTKSLTYDRNTRYIDNLRAAMREAGFRTRELGGPPSLKIDAQEVENFPFEDKPYIAIHPFPHMATFKTLPLRRWKDLIKKIQSKYPEYGIAITGADVDQEQSVGIQKDVEPGVFLGINLSLKKVAYIFKNCSLYIGVDTGPTHLAGVMHVPSVIISQQNEPVWLPDYNPNATLIWSKERCVCGKPGEKCIEEEEGKQYRRCVYYVKNEEILEAVSNKLSK